MPKVARKACARGMLICTLTLGVAVIGCNHALNLGRLDLDPSEQLVVGQLDGCRVSLINNQPDTGNIIVGSPGVHRYEGSLNQITGAVVSQLSFELEKRRAVITKGASKVLKIKVEHVEFEGGMTTMGTRARVRVETGGGYARNIDIETATFGTVNRLYEGVAQIAVTKILQDPRIASYLR